MDFFYKNKYDKLYIYIKGKNAIRVESILLVQYDLVSLSCQDIFTFNIFIFFRCLIDQHH